MGRCYTGIFSQSENIMSELQLRNGSQKKVSPNVRSEEEDADRSWSREAAAAPQERAGMDGDVYVLDIAVQKGRVGMRNVMKTREKGRANRPGCAVPTAPPAVFTLPP
ncbi:hypothetical protein FGB62_18g37 [Gracilaria domingensis]|nr:hypothetical protein FGB62_18g37 [Gracilaria domingensis]